MNLEEMDIQSLLQLQAACINELKRRKVVRTQNNPIGDYTEWLVAKTLGLELENNSKSGYDAKDRTNIRFQIKGRRITSDNPSRQLSAIRKYQEKHFDVLAAVIYDENFDVLEAWLIPHDVIGDYASYREHINAHILVLKGPILTDTRVKCFKHTINNQLP